MANTQITLTIVGQESELIDFIRLCGKIQYCGRAGTCRTIPVVIDGDGSGRLAFWYKKEDGEFEEIPTVKLSEDKEREDNHWIGE